jgi:hypothetical protein
MSIVTNIGYNPITKKNENITKWLKNTDNLVFIINKNKTPVCLTRSFFNLNIIPSNYILELCNVSDYNTIKQILKNDKQDTKYIDISKFCLVDSNIVINYKVFSEIINSKDQQIFLISTISAASDLSLFNEETIMSINKFYTALKSYSGSQYHDINMHLLGPQKKKAPQIIYNLDECLIKYAKHTTTDKIVYRGMKIPYKLEKNGDSIIVPTYLSTSTSLHVTNTFINGMYYTKNPKNKPKMQNKEENYCCIYEITIEPGIPFIDMIYSSLYPNEKEIFLPRNLRMTLTGEFIDPLTKKYIKKIRLSKSVPGQFNTIEKSECKKFYQANISIISVIFNDEEPPYEKQIKPQIKLGKQLKPCKYGDRDLAGKCPKKTKIMELAKKIIPTIIIQPSTKKSPQKIIPIPTKTKILPKPITPPTNNTIKKKPKCPNGTRRNKKTGECEKTFLYH